VLVRVTGWLALALIAGVLVRPAAADALLPTFAAVGHSPTQGTPVPGALLVADLGTWSSPPESYEFQWLRDGTPIAGADKREYVVQVSDIDHQLQPYVTGHSGPEAAAFLGSPLVGRKLGATLRADVRRVHPTPTQHRLVWAAISFLSTERPWATDGAVVAAYKRKNGRLKELGRTVVTRGTAFVRLPWRRAPSGTTRVTVCFLGTDAVAQGCSPYAVVRHAG
jgi:hypothetical protein